MTTSIIACVIYCRSKSVAVDKVLTNEPGSPYIETHSTQEKKRYRINSLDRSASVRLETMGDRRSAALPESCEANIIINDLQNVSCNAIYSEVKPKVPESHYIQLAELGNDYFEFAKTISHRDLQS